MGKFDARSKIEEKQHHNNNNNLSKRLDARVLINKKQNQTRKPSIVGIKQQVEQHLHKTINLNIKPKHQQNQQHLKKTIINNDVKNSLLVLTGTNSNKRISKVINSHDLTSSSNKEHIVFANDNNMLITLNNQHQQQQQHDNNLIINKTNNPNLLTKTIKNIDNSNTHRVDLHYNNNENNLLKKQLNIINNQQKQQLNTIKTITTRQQQQQQPQTLNNNNKSFKIQIQNKDVNYVDDDDDNDDQMDGDMMECDNTERMDDDDYDDNNDETFYTKRRSSSSAKATKTLSSSNSNNNNNNDSSLQGFKLLVSNLHPNVTLEDLMELFSSIGTIKRVQYVKKSVAEVIYVRLDDARQAISKYNGKELDGRVLNIQLTSKIPICEKINSFQSIQQQQHTQIQSAPVQSAQHQQHLFQQKPTSQQQPIKATITTAAKPITNPLPQRLNRSTNINLNQQKPQITPITPISTTPPTTINKPASITTTDKNKLFTKTNANTLQLSSSSSNLTKQTTTTTTGSTNSTQPQNKVSVDLSVIHQALFSKSTSTNTTNPVTFTVKI